MRIIFSFFLALFFYISILFFFGYFIFYKKEIKKKEIVYIHTAVINKIEKKPIQKQIVKSNPIKQDVKIEKKKIEYKTKDKFSQGGKNIKFEDIFSNVNENIPTSKIKHKKKENMTKKVGTYKEVKEKLSKLNKLKTLNVEISNMSGKKSDLNYIQKQLSLVWAKIETNPNDYVKIFIRIYNKQIFVTIISTNLDTIRLDKFINLVKTIDISKINNFEATIYFKAKLKD